MLEATLEALVEHGVDSLTVGAIAEQAGASKATIYSWYGGREGLLIAVVEREAAALANHVEAVLGEPAEVRGQLVKLGRTLLTHLTHPRMVALHRAAIGNREVATAVVDSGFKRVGPIISAQLAAWESAGELKIGHAPTASSIFYGLCTRDVQMRALLIDEQPSAAVITANAIASADAFLALYGDATPNR